MKLKTAIQSLDDVIQVLEMADVKTNTGMTGDIRKFIRVLNSKNEDIVLNCPTSSAEQITENIININVHVPNLQNQPSGSPNSVDNAQPNELRMREIGDYVMEVLDGYRGHDFMIHLNSAGEVIPDGKNWYYNIVIWYTYLRREK